MQIKWEKRFKNEVKRFATQGVDNFGERIALLHLNKLNERISKLATYPELGFPEPFLSNKEREYRALVFEKRYKIIYTVDYDKEIIHLYDFWDMRRNPPTLIQRLA